MLPTGGGGYHDHGGPEPYQFEPVLRRSGGASFYRRGASNGGRSWHKLPPKRHGPPSQPTVKFDYNRRVPTHGGRHSYIYNTKYGKLKLLDWNLKSWTRINGQHYFIPSRKMCFWGVVECILLIFVSQFKWKGDLVSLNYPWVWMWEWMVICLPPPAPSTTQEGESGQLWGWLFWAVLRTAQHGLVVFVLRGRCCWSVSGGETQDCSRAADCFQSHWVPISHCASGTGRCLWGILNNFKICL